MTELLDLSKMEANGIIFSASTVRAFYKAQGKTGKELKGLVDAALKDSQAGLAARDAGMTSEHGMQTIRYKEGTRKDGRAFVTITREQPKVAKEEKAKKELVSENGALRSELEELRKMIAEMRSAKSVAETAPEEPAAVETAMSAALEAAGV